MQSLPENITPATKYVDWTKTNCNYSLSQVGIVKSKEHGNKYQKI